MQEELRIVKEIENMFKPRKNKNWYFRNKDKLSRTMNLGPLIDSIQ